MQYVGRRSGNVVEAHRSDGTVEGLRDTDSSPGEPDEQEWDWGYDGGTPRRLARRILEHAFPGELMSEEDVADFTTSLMPINDSDGRLGFKITRDEIVKWRSTR